MCGLIWFVQIVHYPLFAVVDKTTFVQYQKAHMSLTSWVVIPAMLIELSTGLLFLWSSPVFLSKSAAWLGMILLAVIWLSTALLLVPKHNRLAKAFDAGIHRTLVATNWLRTGAWSMRVLLLTYTLNSALSTHA
jgi:hypothetical protein